MKNAFTIKIRWLVLFLFCSNIILGQQHSLNFQAKQGLTNFKDVKRDFSYSESYNILGGDFLIGLDYRYSFFRKKYFTGCIGILWNTSSFARRSISHANNFLNAPNFSPVRFERTNRFRSHSIIFPIRIKTQVRKIGLSFGLIPRYHLSTKMFYEKIIELENFPFDYELTTMTYEAGKSVPESPLNFGRPESVFLKDKVDLQFSFGLDFYLSERISFELEYRNLINENYLLVRYQRFSRAWSTSPKKYEFSLPTISIGINCRIL